MLLCRLLNESSTRQGLQARPLGSLDWSSQITGLQIRVPVFPWALTAWPWAFTASS